ncbi:VOC family protein [Microbispora corallina]|uniref:Glyoxylase CFP32 n=1 Tax=Microbispora corallina TaxID=83302 RepID=A0ABQ4FVM6_9ACTN|nr:VOC family protein [Microbispora corallina]GIH38862.1 putative glyoxylase CFP32 [Microbispora corallina]
MPDRTSYHPGTPNWVDLRTPDPEQARSFYGPLFGWTFDDRPGPDGGLYSLCRMNGGIVAAIGSAPPDSAPRWTTYLAVDDVDAAVTEVEAAGGRLLTPPYGVGAMGRAALVADPGGVAFGLWEAGEHVGATVVNEPGAFVWSELMTEGREAAPPFYERVAGLTTTTVDLGGAPFTGFVAGGTMVGGVIAPPREGVEQRWIVYFSAADVEDLARRAEGLGGTVVHGPIDSPVGPLAALRDPQGAPFSVWAVRLPAG